MTGRLCDEFHPGLKCFSSGSERNPLKMKLVKVAIKGRRFQPGLKILGRAKWLKNPCYCYHFFSLG